jgi:hypothetical protein
MGSWFDFLLYIAGVGALLLSYLAFSPMTRDLVVFLSRDAQIAIFKRRRLLWAIGLVCLGLLGLRAVVGSLGLDAAGALARAVGSAGPSWLWILAVTALLLGLAFWATYVPVVMAPPKTHKTVNPHEADRFLRPDSVVLGLAMDGVVRAYPRDLIARPHWFNDIVGGKSLMISYCILCNSGQAFVPRLKNGERLDLRNMTAFDNNTIYHDVRSGNFIQQLEGKVIRGPDEGEMLEAYPVVMARWSDWKTLHPGTMVYYAPPVTLRDRVVQRMLETMIPISKLAARAKPWHLVRKPLDARLPAMSFVFGVEVNQDACAYPLTSLRTSPVLNDEVGGEPIVVLFDLALDIGAVFSRRLDSHRLTFSAIPKSESGAVARDQETRSGWDVAGRAVDGPLAGRTLQALPHYNQLFWFSWAAFKPGTRIRTDEDRRPERVPASAVA